MAMEDERLRERSRPISTLLAGPGSKLAARPALPDTDTAEPGSWDEIDPLPLAGSAYTAAHSRASSKPEIVLHVMLNSGYSRGYAWSNFDSVDTAPGDGPGTGPVLVVRFAGLVPTELRISGSNLGKLHALIGRQRIAWLREQPSKRGFDATASNDDKAAVITSITVRPWKPERPTGGSDE